MGTACPIQTSSPVRDACSTVPSVPRPVTLLEAPGSSNRRGPFLAGRARRGALGLRRSAYWSEGLSPARLPVPPRSRRSEEHTSELQSLAYLVCRLLLEKKKKKSKSTTYDPTL